MDLTFKITKQKLERTDSEEPVDKSIKYLNTVFDFKTSEWDTLRKRALFMCGDCIKLVELDTDDSCIVPWEALGHHYFIVTVFGVDDSDKRVTTNSVQVDLVGSDYCDDYSSSSEHTKDLVELLVESKFDDVRIENNTLLFYANDELKETVDLETATTIAWENVTGKPETFPASDSSLEVCLNGLAREINLLD